MNKNFVIILKVLKNGKPIRNSSGAYIHVSIKTIIFLILIFQKQIRTTGIRGRQNAVTTKPESNTSNLGLSLPIRDHLSAKVDILNKKVRLGGFIPVYDIRFSAVVKNKHSNS